MYLVAFTWIFIVTLMALAEAMSSQGTVLGAIFTFLLYGALPASIVFYVMGAPRRRDMRREMRRREELAQSDAGSHAPAEASSAVREEP